MSKRLDIVFFIFEIVDGGLGVVESFERGCS